MSKFDKIEIPQIPDLIIKQILELVKTGQLEPGEQLPSELSLQKSLGVAKQQIKAAFKKLELYGVLETKPQNGTFIAEIDSRIIIGLIENILDIREIIDPVSLMDTRILLETRAVELAAERINDDELNSILHANELFCANSKESIRAVEDDIFFHLEIIRYSKSPVLISLYSFITRQLIELWRSYDEGNSEIAALRIENTINEHHDILKYLKEGNSLEAAKVMRLHLLESMNSIKLN